MRLSIKGKFVAASLSIIFLMSGLILFLLGVQKSLESRMNEMIQTNLSAIRKAEQIKYDIVLYDDLVFRYLSTDQRPFLTEAVEALEEAKAWIEDMKTIVQGETEKEVLSDIENETLRYHKGIRKLIELYQLNKAVPAPQKIVDKRGFLDLFSPLQAELPAPPKRSEVKGKENIAHASAVGKSRLVRIYSQCEKIVDIYRAKLDNAQLEMNQKIARTRRAVLITGGAVFLLAISIITLLALEILSPIRNLLTGVQKVASGQLDLELDVYSSDEIGRLTQHFNSMTRSLKEKQERLIAETITDPLTGLNNLRYFQNSLQTEIGRAHRHKRSFALLIVDIDYFKTFNDANGHQMGNVILKEVANIIKSSVRGDGICARYGGEEFAMILPETDAEGGKAVAERIRSNVEKTIFPGQDNQPQKNLTVSVGGATFPQNGSVASELFERADQALYKAKNSGRNRVVWA